MKLYKYVSWDIYLRCDLTDQFNHEETEFTEISNTQLIDLVIKTNK